jgi:hypothetical protein
MLRQMINWRGCGSKRPLYNRGTIPACAWGLRRTTTWDLEEETYYNAQLPHRRQMGM